MKLIFDILLPLIVLIAPFIYYFVTSSKKKSVFERVSREFKAKLEVTKTLLRKTYSFQAKYKDTVFTVDEFSKGEGETQTQCARVTFYPELVCPFISIKYKDISDKILSFSGEKLQIENIDKDFHITTEDIDYWKRNINKNIIAKLKQLPKNTTIELLEGTLRLYSDKALKHYDLLKEIIYYGYDFFKILTEKPTKSMETLPQVEEKTQDSRLVTHDSQNICPRCKSKIPLNYRVCPVCRYELKPGLKINYSFIFSFFIILTLIAYLVYNKYEPLIKGWVKERTHTKSATPLKLQKHKVTITYNNKNAREVYFAWEGNKWNPKKDRMSGPDRNGNFNIGFELYPGKYQYKFVVDGEWTLDPKASTIKDGEFTNSLLIVGTENEIKLAWNQKIIEQRKKINLLASIGKEISVFNKQTDIKHFAVFGDSRGNPHLFRKILLDIKQREAEFVVFTGDLVNRPEFINEWVEMFEIIKESNLPFFMVPGNHDIMDTSSYNFYRDIFFLPDAETYYSLKFKNIKMLVLSSEDPNYVSTFSDTQFVFLKNELSSDTPLLKFVCIHRPFYPDKELSHHYKDSMNKNPRFRDQVWETFIKNKVKSVFSSHDHFFYVNRVAGLYEFISGGGGAKLYAPPSKGGFYHYLLVNIKEKDIIIEVYKFIEERKSFEKHKTFFINQE
ncbi:MAG: metallophosphoesterase [Candidatus Hydrogenedentota bacterium]